MLIDIAKGVKTQISSRVLNMEDMTEMALAAFFAGGHILLSRQVGLGKTEWAGALAQALGMTCKTERFYNDFQPGGELHQGPVPTQIYMAEAVGYAHPRVQTIISEAMDRTNKTNKKSASDCPITEPLFIIATYDEALPDFLCDRFMLKMTVPYPGIAAEKQLLQMHHAGIAPDPAPLPVCNLEAIVQAKEEVCAVAVEDSIFNLIISIAETTRRIGAVKTGVSPRGSIALMTASKAYAALQGRDYVMADDVKALAIPVLSHRIRLKPDALKEGVQAEHIIEGILNGRK